MSVYLLRHAESLYNSDHKHDFDCGLTIQGIGQASAIKGLYDLVVVSPLRRALETLTHSDIRGPVETWYEVREIVCSRCDLIEGESFVVESEESILDRVEKFKQKLRQVLESHNKVLVVTHADFIWYLTSSVSQGERYGTWANNGEIVRLDI